MSSYTPYGFICRKCTPLITVRYHPRAQLTKAGTVGGEPREGENQGRIARVTICVAFLKVNEGGRGRGVHTRVYTLRTLG